MIRVAILDDYQSIALKSGDWERLRRRGCAIEVFEKGFVDKEEAIARLQPFNVLVPMRERMPLSRDMIERLPNLRFISLTGLHALTLDSRACWERGIPVSNTRSQRTTGVTAELAFGLLLCAARDIARADRLMRRGGWQEGLALGVSLAGRRLGVIGLGKLGASMARYAKAFGMEVVAWSPNLTHERAREAGVGFVSKEDLLATSDFVSLHLVLSERTRGIISATDLALMKKTAVLINTARAGLVDEDAMIDALRAGRLSHAALDVYGREPLASNHPLRELENVTLSPHVGYVAQEVFAEWYGDAIENVEAWMDGNPIRVINADRIQA